MRHRHLIPAFLILAAPALVAQTKPAAPNLTDPEVAHVAVTANTIDINLAKLAEQKAAKPEVKQFAETMIRDHSAVNAKATELAGQLKVTPKDNAVSKSLEDGAASARASIEKLSGSAFDKAYIDREIAYHQAVLDALDGVLIPTTENADLKKLLTDVRPAIAAHLAHAKEIRHSIGMAE
jgi:putative membrane protein